MLGCFYNSSNSGLDSMEIQQKYFEHKLKLNSELLYSKRIFTEFEDVF